jgi:uncharacterized protein
VSNRPAARKGGGHFLPQAGAGTDPPAPAVVTYKMKGHAPSSNVDQQIPKTTGLKGIALLFVGFVALVLAVAGAILPVMPATPFILLAVYCFARTSHRCHTWLTQNRLFGRYVVYVAQGRALSRWATAALVASCWATAALSVVFIAPNLPARLSGLSIAAAMTAYLLLRGRGYARRIALSRSSSR